MSRGLGGRSNTYNSAGDGPIGQSPGDGHLTGAHVVPRSDPPHDFDESKLRGQERLLKFGLFRRPASPGRLAIRLRVMAPLNSPEYIGE